MPNNKITCTNKMMCTNCMLSRNGCYESQTSQLSPQALNVSATPATEPATLNDVTQLNQSQIYEEVSEAPNKANGYAMVKENGPDDPNLEHTHTAKILGSHVQRSNDTSIKYHISNK